MSRKLFILLAAATFAASLVSASVAFANTPTTAEMPGDYSVTITGSDSPCNFHIPGSGIVWAQGGRFVFRDIGAISYSGLNTLDTTALCAALSP